MADYAAPSSTAPDSKTPKSYPPALYDDVLRSLTSLEYDVVKRNEYMRTRYDAIYEDGLFRDLDIDGWFAQYNLVERVVDIHTTQLFGRNFNMVSTYTKDDVSVYSDQDPDQAQAKQMMKLKNKKLKADADLRMKVARSIITDNGGMAKFEDGGRLGSAIGTTIYKVYPDTEAKRVVISLLETPQNYRAGWNGSDFRERDWDAYVYQISLDKANREYGYLLKNDNDTFGTSQNGFPFLDSFGGSSTTDPLNQASTGKSAETQRPMVSVIDFTGFCPRWTVKDGELVACKRGEEKPFSVFIVGGIPAEVITDPKKLPKYYIVNNRQKPRHAWGEADVSDSLIEINKEIVRLMADSMTWADKNLWKIIQAKGLTPEAISKLKGKPRKTRVIGMGIEQSLEEVATNSQPLTEFQKLIQEKLDFFMRLSGTGRLLFDDPTQSSSNQALMTTLKGVVDIVESKQKRWTPELIAMFTDALHMAADFIPGLEDALTDDPSWEFLVEWPSVLRREDPAYQTMWLNFMNRGVVSAETFMQKALPVYDTEEELDRIRDEMEDPIMAAMMGNQLGEIAHQTLNKSLGIPPWGYVVPKLSVKGELSPQEMGNIAHNYSWDQGPYGPAIGPTGYQGTQANENFDNANFVKGGTGDGAQPNYQGPQQANPQLTTDQNTGQTASQPGSGAPAVSPAGAVAQVAQNKGH